MECQDRVRRLLDKSTMLLDDAESLRKYRIVHEDSVEGEFRGGGNWSIPILCFIVLDALATMYWLARNPSLFGKSSTDSLVSDEEKKEKETKVFASTKFVRLVMDSDPHAALTFERDEQLLREIWTTFRNHPVHNAIFLRETGGVVFFRDGMDNEYIGKLVADIDKLANHPGLNDEITGEHVPLKAFFRRQGELYCFGDVLVSDVRRLASWFESQINGLDEGACHRILKQFKVNNPTVNILIAK